MISWMEIILLIVGAGLFVASFLIPENKEKTTKENRMLAREEIRTLVSKELENVQEHVDEVVEEAMTYAMEKTERSLERLSNEKIMAVNEYSELVLKEINKNHEEVMFLYDMLNDKHSNLKNTVSEANKAAKEVEESTKEAEAVVETMQKLTVEPMGAPVEEFKELAFPTVEASEEERIVEPVSVISQLVVSGNQNKDAFAAVRNKNDEILNLYRAGNSFLDIAKTLNLGVGEVKLVIDLYKDM